LRAVRAAGKVAPVHAAFHFNLMTVQTLSAGQISHAQQRFMANHASLVKQQAAGFCGTGCRIN